MFLFSLLSAAFIVIDLVSKRLAVQFLAVGKELVLIPHYLRFIYVENHGAAFGLLEHYPLIMIIVGLAVACYILYYVQAELCKSRIQYYGLIFLFAGTLGNLINRLFLGYVIDFIDLPNWPTFNFADIFINIGVGLLVIYLLRKK
jgi:signal peptidase II